MVVFHTEHQQVSARHPIYQLLRTRATQGPDVVEAGREEVGGEGRHYLGNQFQPKSLDKSLSMGHLETLSKYETKRSKTERVVKNCSYCHLWLTQLVQLLGLLDSEMSVFVFSNPVLYSRFRGHHLLNKKFSLISRHLS